MNITHINILTIPVKDQEAAKAFYSKKLGFKVVRDDAIGGQRWLQLAPDGAQTSVTLLAGGRPMTPGSQQGVVLITQDVRADRETLKSRGIAISEIENAPWGSYATFSDPDGNGWVLQQAPA